MIAKVSLNIIKLYWIKLNKESPIITTVRLMKQDIKQQITKITTFLLAAVVNAKLTVFQRNNAIIICKPY